MSQQPFDPKSNAQPAEPLLSANLSVHLFSSATRHIRSYIFYSLFQCNWPRWHIVKLDCPCGLTIFLKFSYSEYFVMIFWLSYKTIKIREIITRISEQLENQSETIFFPITLSYYVCPLLLILMAISHNHQN